MMIHDITAMVGKHKQRKRIGRGHGSGWGKTAGRGHKGAKSRAGFSHRPYFEGGQMSFVRRIPKRGFTNAPFRTEYHVVNVRSLDRLNASITEITSQVLADAGVIRNTKLPLKVLGEGDVTRSFSVTAAKFSASARSKIEAAGGSCNQVEKVKWTRKAAAAKAKADSAQ